MSERGAPDGEVSISVPPLESGKPKSLMPKVRISSSEDPRIILQRFMTGDSALVLMHETMHSLFNSDDESLANRLNGGPISPNADGTLPDYSAWINDWLQQKCGVN